MKTGGMEVLCDGCGAPIKPMHPRAIFVTLRGPQVGHKKADVCDVYCLMTWARLQHERGLGVTTESAQRATRDMLADMHDEIDPGDCAP